MKKTVLAAIVAMGLGTGFVYANDTAKAATELEHATKTASSDESVSADMSKMKAAGKCGAEQSGKMKAKMKKAEAKTGKAATELEHATKTASSDESVDGKMKKMKAAGKCNSGQ